MKWPSLLQMPWLEVVWTIVILCFEVCHVLISTSCSVLHWLSWLITKPCSRPKHWPKAFFTEVFQVIFEPSLSPSSCSYSTRHSHPDGQYFTLPGMNFQTLYAVQHLLHPSEKSSKVTCLQKPFHHSLSVTSASSFAMA